MIILALGNAYDRNRVDFKGSPLIITVYTSFRSLPLKASS